MDEFAKHGIALSSDRYNCVIKITVPELGHRFDQVRLNELSDPLRWFLTKLGLEFDFQDTIGEQFLIFRGELLERMVNPDIHPPPVVSRSRPSIPVIFTDHGKLGIERDTDASISRELEGGSVVEGTHYYANEGQETPVKGERNTYQAEASWPGQRTEPRSPTGSWNRLLDGSFSLS